MRRRDFIQGIAGSTTALPLGARAQQSKRPVIGFLNSGRPEMATIVLAGLRQGLNDSGYVEGQNIEIEFRWAKDQHDKLPTLAADLVRQQVAVIVATGGIISGSGGQGCDLDNPDCLHKRRADPVTLGLVASLNQPGGNVTGVSYLQTTLEAKRFELLHELVLGAAEIAALINPNNPAATGQQNDLDRAARDLNLQLLVLHADRSDALDPAFATLARKQHVPLAVTSDPYFFS